MRLLAFYAWILLLNHALASDMTGQQNDIIPDQVLQIPYGMFCFFTMSELMFTDRMQQVAPSAYRVCAARLTDMKMISSTSYSYENLWGAVYFAQREDYSSIIQYARSRDTVAFVSTMEIETIENESGLCVLTDVGLQPYTYPPSQDCSQCYGFGGSSNMPSASDYQQELASMGVPSSYFQTMGQTPGMQSPSGNPSAQTQGSSPTPSLGASASGPTPSLGAAAQGNLSPNSLGASAAAQTPPLAAQANLSPNSLGASAQTPPLGASAQAGLSPSPSLSASANGPTPSLGASARGSLPSPTGSSTDQGQGTRNGHQLRSPYPQSVVPPPSTYSNNMTPPYAPFDNQFVPQSAPLQPVSSSTGSLGAGVYQPTTNFSGGFNGGGGGSPQSIIPGFSFASYSGQYSFLSAQGGNSFMNYQ